METIEYDAMQAQEQRFWWYRALHEITLARLHRQINLTDGNLLDAGCGTGGLLTRIQQDFPRATLTGLEHHPAGIEHLKTLKGIKIVNSDINAMPFVDNYFDVITLNDVLYHDQVKPENCLKECWRILKPGGHLLINVAAYNWMRSTHDQRVHTRERYTRSKLKQQLTEANFQIKQSGYWNSLLFPLMVLHRLTSGKIKTNSDVESIPAWQDNLFYRIIHWEQTLQQHHIYLPFGGSAWAWANKL